jgi:MFS family permease
MSLGGFAVANIGAFLSFLPLMQILIPLKAAEIAPGGAPALLGTVAAVGAVVAGAANFVAGWLSDRTRSRFGRRRPWIVGGVVGVAVSYAVIWQAHSATGLVLAFALFQLAFNVMFAPLLALTADRVPTARRGWVSALIALGMPIGTAIGTVPVGTLVTDEAQRYAALGIVVLIAIVPFALGLSTNPPAPRPAGDMTGNYRWLSRNFALGWLSRITVIAAHTVAQLYLLFYVAQTAPGAPHAAERGVALLGVVFGIASSAAAFVNAGRIPGQRGGVKAGHC